jgi:calcium-dependent protein kinase
LLRAVRYLHDRHICHRDLKSENLLLEKKGGFDPNCNRLKVADFGLATLIPPGILKTTKVGTPSHMAPEVFERNYNKACDIWSCGVILYFMLFAENPFMPKDVQLNQFRVRFRTKGAEDVSEESRALISSLLTKSVSQRISAAEALDHPWFGLACQAEVQKCLDRVLVMDLLQYRRRTTVQQLFLNLVSSLLEESAMTASRALFAGIDVAGKGLIDLLDHTDGLPKDWLDIINQGSRKLCLRFSFTEFLAATFERQMSLTKDACNTAFSLLDTDSDGIISCSEVMINVGKSRFIPTQIAELSFPDADKKEDGPIDFNAFWTIVTDKPEL